MSTAEKHADFRLCPVRSLAVCGARRPTKLMSPVTLTAAATVSVARKRNEKTCYPDGYAEHAGLILTDRECQKMAVEQEDQRGGAQDDRDRKRDL